MLRVSLQSYQSTISGQGSGEPDGAVAPQCPNLKNPPGFHGPSQNLEQLSLVRCDADPWEPDSLTCLECRMGRAGL